MSQITTQSSANAQSTLKIVIRTVHGDLISVRMDQLGGKAKPAIARKTPRSESPATIRNAG